MPKPKQKQKAQLDPSLDVLLKSDAFKKIIDWIDLVYNPALRPLHDDPTPQQTLNHWQECRAFKKVISTMLSLNVVSKQQSIKSDYKS